MEQHKVFISFLVVFYHLSGFLPLLVLRRFTTDPDSMSWCEPFPASRGDDGHGACTSLTGGPRSFKSPASSRAALSDCDVQAHASSFLLPRASSPDCHGREDALMNIANPCSYRHRLLGGAHKSAVESDEDDEPAVPAPKTRFTSKGHSEGLTEGRPELPPRRRQDVTAAPVQAAKIHFKNLSFRD